MENTTTVPTDQLQKLLEENKAMKADVQVLINSTTAIMDVLGLVDHATGKVKQELLTGEISPMGDIIKGLGDTVALMTQASIPLIGRKAEKRMEEKFAFIKELLPLIKKYA